MKDRKKGIRTAKTKLKSEVSKKRSKKSSEEETLFHEFSKSAHVVKSTAYTCSVVCSIICFKKK